MKSQFSHPGTPPRSPGPLLAHGDMPRSALVFESMDLDFAREEVGRVYCPYRFHASRQRRWPASMSRLQGESVALSWFTYGADISIAPEVFGDFVLVLTTLAGRADIRSGSIEHMGGAGSTMVIARDAPSRYRYSPDNVQLGVRIDARRLDEYWRRLSGRSLPGGLSSWVLDAPGQRDRWLASVEMLRQLLHPDTPKSVRTMLLPRAEELLIMNLVADRLGGLSGADGAIAPACLRRAMAFIDEQAGQPLTLAAIAAAAHCSIRTLQRVFHQWRDIGVMRYVKEVRLQRVREALLDPEQTASITEIASRWGFAHLGQFAADYRKAYGERPSDTRLRA
ncbi:AraC family transcriptional regulator [Pseudomonas sp. Q1-7]|uniref:AraC family transcriptional regulator n=1 Tax=Pseudomonas sp. Q1-7 TaxID=3020843 RepID=UPI0023014A4B|nr:AraC family transcriptional regulator [Pseudomonas sp. Q1-7]